MMSSFDCGNGCNTSPLRMCNAGNCANAALHAHTIPQCDVAALSAATLQPLRRGRAPQLQLDLKLPSTADAKLETIGACFKSYIIIIIIMIAHCYLV